MTGVCTLVLICLGHQTSVAQTPTSFPDEDGLFIEAFAKYLGKSKREDAYTSAATFTETFNGLSAEMKAVVKTTAAAMLKNRVRNYPVYPQYANTVTLVASQKGTVPQEHIVVLRDLIEAAQSGSYKQFEQYMKYLPDLFDHYALNKTATKLWSFNPEATYTTGVENGKPYLDFETVDITGMSKRDSVRIISTSGRCFPIGKDWIGSKGNYYFSRAGWSESEVIVELNDYELALDKVDFVFDSVYFSMPEYLDGKILGQVTERLYSTTPQTMSYPRFKSAEADLELKNIDERLTTSGGFRLEARKMIIFGNDEKAASVYLSTDGVKQVKASARRFLIKVDDQEVIAENVEVHIFMKKDSIFHPSLIFRYDMSADELELQRSEGIASNLPFKSSYHQMDLGFNMLLWKLDSAYINLKTISTYTDEPVSFTSYEHYIPQGELKYLTLTGRNPLRMIRDLADSYGTMDLHGEDVAGMMGYPLQQIENVLYKLTKDGFVYYDPVSKRMVVDYKVFHYMDAGKGDIDFDHLIFESDPKGSDLNGTISVDSSAITIRGVSEFTLSNLKKVTLAPRESDVILTEDRDLDMEGKLKAGKLEFKGSGMHFDYEGFQVDMQEVDSMQIYVKGDEMDAYGEYPDVPLKSIISNIKGTLFIDDPGNKSGLIDYPEYPYFESYDTAYVFFDDNYDSTTFPRDEFYFAIYPFTLDSIAKTITDSLSFYGKFVSGDIFNPFETFISVQKDLTLGIDEITPENGLAIYQSAGMFFDNYVLKKDGLFGKGRITYRQAEMESKKFEFYPDSLYANVDTFHMVSDAVADVPQLSVDKAEVYWLPYLDSMFVIKHKEKFRMYNRRLNYSGDIVYKGGALSGQSDSTEMAKHRMEGARILGDATRFYKNHFIVDSATLDLYLPESESAIVTVSRVNADVNFKTKKGEFATVADTVITVIPGNQLITDFRDFEWDMVGQKVTFRNSEALDYFFISTLPAYDSLQFNAASAVYDMLENKTYANEVSDIHVADSKLIPPNEELIILQGGTIEPMSNATLVLNRIEEFHTIENADLVIKSRNDFSGTGSYYYPTVTGDPYTIFIDEISVREDTTGIIVKKKGAKEVEKIYMVRARGVIPDEDGFRLDEQLLYKGNAYIYSNDRDIAFEGFAKLDLKQNEESAWFNMNQGIDPDNFSLSVDSLIDETKQQVVAGLFISPGELEIYSAVMNPKRSTRDPAIHQVKGSLFKGELSGEYLFGSADAVSGVDATGSIMKYDDNTGALEINGELSWVSDIPLVNVAGFGKLNYDPTTGKASAVSSIAIDFPMDESIWYQLPRDIVEYQDKVKGINYKRPEIKRMLRHFIPNENTVETIIGDIEAEGYFQLPATFPYKILLTDVELNWDPLDGNFKSTNTIGISSINKYPIDLQVKAYTEFGYSMGTNYMNLYFETSSGEWYFFSTKRGKMYVMSSDQSFNDAVVNSDNKEVREGKKGDVIYEFQPGNLTSKLTFMARFDDYLSRLKGVPTEETSPEIIPAEVNDEINEEQLIEGSEEDVVPDEDELPEPEIPEE